jgi:hypothetical protein
MMELSQKMDGVLMLQAVTAEAEVMEAEAETAEAEAGQDHSPTLLEPENIAEPGQKSKPRKTWLF